MCFDCKWGLANGLCKYLHCIECIFYERLRKKVSFQGKSLASTYYLHYDLSARSPLSLSNKLENKVESWILCVLNCGKRLEAMKLVITSVRPRTRLLEQGGGGGAEQALGFASLYYNRHCCQYYIHQHHQQHHHFPKHGCDDPFKNRAFGALSSVGSMTELPWHSNNNVLLVFVKGHFGGIEFFGSSGTLAM